MRYLQRAWDIVIPHAWNWVVVTIFFLYLLSVGIGLLFVPNMVRIARKAADDGVPPSVSDLFCFDFFADDALAVILQKIIIVASLSLCLVGAPILALLLYWTIHLAADRAYAPIDCIKAAFLYGKSNFLHTFVNVVVIHLVVYLGILLTCGLGAVLGLPVLTVALERFYRSELPTIYAVADAHGLVCQS